MCNKFIKFTFISAVILFILLPTFAFAENNSTKLSGAKHFFTEKNFLIDMNSLNSETITKETLAVMLVHILKQEKDASVSPLDMAGFSDVPSTDELTAHYILWITGNGIINSDAYPKFGYGRKVTVFEAEEAILYALGYKDISNDDVQKMADNLGITNDTIYKGNPNDNDTLSGSTLVIMLYNALYAKQKDGIVLGEKLGVIERKLTPTSKTNRIGNTNGNVFNDGIAAIQGDYIYYANGIGFNNSMYREKIDGSEKMKYDESWIHGLNVVGSWIYYANYNGNIYKMRIDGASKVEVSSISAKNLIVIGAWIYYINLSDYNIYKMKIDGTNVTRLCNDSAEFMNIEGSQIFYKNNSEGGTIYKMRLDGKGRRKIINKYVNGLIVNNGAVYYLYGFDLYKSNGNGGARVKLNKTGTEVFYFNVDDNWIYYSDHKDSWKLYKMKKDGTDITKLNDQMTTDINVIGDWIYYIDLNSAKMFKMTKDGNTIIEVYLGTQVSKDQNSSSNGFTDTTDINKPQKDSITYKKDSLRGNTPGNSINGNIIAQDGDWVYYISTGDWSINKMKADGSDHQKIYDGYSLNLRVLNGWIYFSGFDSGIYKITTNGTDMQLVTNDNPDGIDVVGDWIYYRNRDDGYTLYKIKTDGTGRKKVSIDTVNEFVAFDDRIFYTNGDDWSKIYTMDTDGNNKREIGFDNARSIVVDGDFIYFYGASSNELGLYKIGIDGTGLEKLSDEEVISVNVSGDWIYYGTRDTSKIMKNSKGPIVDVSGAPYTLYKIKKDGTQKTKLNNDGAFEIYTTSDWIYYSDGSGHYTKIKPDGSQKDKAL